MVSICRCCLDQSRSIWNARSKSATDAGNGRVKEARRHKAAPFQSTKRESRRGEAIHFSLESAAGKDGNGWQPPRLPAGLNYFTWIVSR